MIYSIKRGPTHRAALYCVKIAIALVIDKLILVGPAVQLPDIRPHDLGGVLGCPFSTPLLFFVGHFKAIIRMIGPRHFVFISFLVLTPH